MVKQTEKESVAKNKAPFKKMQIKLLLSSLSGLRKEKMQLLTSGEHSQLGYIVLLLDTQNTDIRQGYSMTIIKSTRKHGHCATHKMLNISLSHPTGVTADALSIIALLCLSYR